MATHAVILLDHPPAILYVLTALVLRFVEKGPRHVGSFRAHATQQKRSQGIAPFRSQEGLGHSQLIFRILLFTAIVNRRFSKLVFEESFVVVPGLLCMPATLGSTLATRRAGM